MTTTDLQRFVDAQARDFATALSEIEAGRKRSHWIWYVLPQIGGLGSSPMAARYAITSVAEARAFLAHPVLGANYRRIVAAIRAQVERGVRLDALLGWPDDAKTISSITLFAGVAAPGDPLIADAGTILRTAAAEGLPACAATERFLAAGD